MAFVAPILPGKTEDWRRFVGELNSARHSDYQDSRRRLGIHERVFLQSTPMGDMVIVTLEGDDPQGAMVSFANGRDEFARWFVQRVKELHGFDLAQVAQGPSPEQALDSAREIRQKAA